MNYTLLLFTAIIILYKSQTNKLQYEINVLNVLYINTIKYSNIYPSTTQFQYPI